MLLMVAIIPNASRGDVNLQDQVPIQARRIVLKMFTKAVGAQRCGEIHQQTHQEKHHHHEQNAWAEPELSEAFDPLVQLHAKSIQRH